MQRVCRVHLLVIEHAGSTAPFQEMLLCWWQDVWASFRHEVLIEIKSVRIIQYVSV